MTTSNTIAAFAILLVPVPSYCQTENLQLSSAEWRVDLAFLALELPKRHANAIHYTPRERFEAAVAALDSQIAHLNSDQIWTGMQRIVALVGDGHTYLKTRRDAANLPIEIVRFGDDYRIVSVVAGLENALGARVLRTPTSRAAEMVLPLAAHDENPPLAQAFVEDALSTGATLHGLGIPPDRNAVRYTLAGDAGREFQQPPLYRQNPDSKFWCRYLPEARTLYCNVRAMRNLYAASKEMLALGAVTFSGAMNNAAQFRSQTAALLVGQTIGEEPNSYADPLEMALPDSHLIVRYSTRYYEFSEGPENEIRPNREIIPSWADHRAGRDAVLEWVLDPDPKPSGGGR